MATTIKRISQEFAKGNFKDTYDDMAEDIQWIMPGSKTMKGRKEVIAFCNKMDIEMAGTVVTTTSCIADGNIVVIQGYCTYVKQDKPSKGEFCEVYLFKDGQLLEIKTYYIEVQA